MAVSNEGNEIKKKLLVNPKRILGIAKGMGGNVRKVETLFNELTSESILDEKWFDKLEEMLDLAVVAIIDTLRIEFRRQGLGEFDVEKHFFRAMMDLKRCTPETIRRAQRSIKRAKLEAKRLQKIKKEAVDTVSKIETMLKETKKVGKAWSLRSEHRKIEDSVEEVVNALDRGNYELALHLAKAVSEKAKEYQDIKFIALRYAAKAGHVIGKLRADGSSSIAREKVKRLSTFLSTVKFLLEEEDYKTALLLAREAKYEAESLLPPDKTGIHTIVCPICFDVKCPNIYCNLNISPSPLRVETCRTYCICGTFYHICCLQKGDDLTCVSCYRPL